MVAKALTKAEAREFFALIDKTGSSRNGERVVARLKLNSFILKHGHAACQAVYDKVKAKAKNKRK